MITRKQYSQSWLRVNAGKTAPIQLWNYFTSTQAVSSASLFESRNIILATVQHFNGSISYLPTILDFPELLRKITSNYGITARAKIITDIFWLRKVNYIVAITANNSCEVPVPVGKPAIRTIDCDLCRHLPRNCCSVCELYRRRVAPH